MRNVGCWSILNNGRCGVLGSSARTLGAALGELWDVEMGWDGMGCGDGMGWDVPINP